MYCADIEKYRSTHNDATVTIIYDGWHCPCYRFKTTANYLCGRARWYRRIVYVGQQLFNIQLCNKNNQYSFILDYLVSVRWILRVWNVVAPVYFHFDGETHAHRRCIDLTWGYCQLFCRVSSAIIILQLYDSFFKSRKFAWTWFTVVCPTTPWIRPRTGWMLLILPG